ncbi:MAG: hybrid sensor histidine kinase/response regulator [Candidatus Acidiferrales bacterium]
MTDLFRQEIHTQVAILTDGLLLLERDSSASEKLPDLMRAAHSLKGAARIVGCDAAVRIAHAMEDCFVSSQKKSLQIGAYVDRLLVGIDLLTSIGEASGLSFESWANEHAEEIEAFLVCLRRDSDQPKFYVSPTDPWSSAVSAKTSPNDTTDPKRESVLPPGSHDRSLRVTADNLNRLLALAGESLVASRWLASFVSRTSRVKHLNDDLDRASHDLRELASNKEFDDRAVRMLNEVRKRIAENRLAVSEHLVDLDRFDRRFSSLSTRLYQEVVDCRMRPLADCMQGFPRLVRDIAKSLGKRATLEVLGDTTTIDRDILELVKAPIDHLLRNAIDHGIESTEARKRVGKPEEGVLRLEAAHRAGRLIITVSDDGCGIEIDRVRSAIVARKLATAEMAKTMSDVEILEFLFLPGFTLRDVVSETSGRGVGLDVVQTMVKSVAGNVNVFSERGKGTRFQLELPLTLSVIRTLVVEISGEPYAIPLSRIETTLKIPFDRIQSIEGRQHFSLADQQIGIVGASEVLELDSKSHGSELPIVVLGNKNGRYGLVVDRFIGERELVVRSLDPRLGKVKNVAAAALMPDGSPLLIVDVEDLIREIERSLLSRRPGLIDEKNDGPAQQKCKHVLVVDDSLTVRELERKLLDAEGYTVDVAVDGMDGWNAVRTGQYDLVLTDVDMPRMDGIELVSLIRKDSRLNSLPVMIVSYKDRPEDRQRGLDAGADYYLTKGSFQDQTLVRAVADLIGAA